MVIFTWVQTFGWAVNDEGDSVTHLVDWLLAVGAVIAAWPLLPYALKVSTLVVINNGCVPLSISCRLAVELVPG